MITKNKDKIKQEIKELEQKNRESYKKYGKPYDNSWKKIYGEYGLLKAKLEGYKLAEKDIEQSK